MDKSTFTKHVAAMAIVGLSATACLGEAPQPPVEIFVPAITVRHQPSEAGELFDFTEGEETGFTVHVDSADAQTHGLPAELAFVGERGGIDAVLRAEMSAYAPGGDPIPDQFDCFGPVEVRDATGAVTVTIDDFCPDDNTPELTIVGDLTAGGDPRWFFDSPDGRVRTNFDE